MTDKKNILEKYEDLESEICDLHNMTNIVGGFVEDKMNGKHRRIMCGDRELVTVTVREANLVTFAVYQIEKMAKELHEKFYEIREARK